MKNTDYSDQQFLIDQLLIGDEHAFRFVVTSYYQSMMYVAKSIVGPAIAEEVIQEAWVSVIKALPRFERRSSLKTWVLRIVSNSAKTRLRKESRSVAMGNAQDVEIAGLPEERFKDDGHWTAAPAHWNLATPDELLSSEGLREVIYQTIDSLPAIQQSIINLRDMDGLEMNEICKILDISESNSRVLLHRARTKIWQAIEKYQESAC